MFNTTVVPSDQNKKQINERIFFNYLVFQFLQYNVYTYSSKINVQLYILLGILAAQLLLF